MTEYWVDLCDEEGNHGHSYQISSLGRVRSIDRIVTSRWGTPMRRAGKILACKIHHTGYVVVGYSVNGKNKQRIVSRLVAFSFYGPPKDKNMEACHGNGDRLDNRKDNIRWGTKLENAADKKLHGRHPSGSKNGNAMLNEDGVNYIIEMWKRGIPQNEIAANLNIPAVTVNHVVTGRTWSDHTGIVWEPRRANISSDDIRMMRTLKELGCTLHDIGQMLKISKAAVFRHTAPNRMN